MSSLIDSTDNISNDYGKTPRNNLTTKKIISLTILVIILTLIVAYIFYYLYTNSNTEYTENNSFLVNQDLISSNKLK